MDVGSIVRRHNWNAASVSKYAFNLILGGIYDRQ